MPCSAGESFRCSIADDISAVWELAAEWKPFGVDVSPAISAEDGLNVGPEVFGRRGRLHS